MISMFPVSKNVHSKLDWSAIHPIAGNNKIIKTDVTMLPTEIMVALCPDGVNLFKDADCSGYSSALKKLISIKQLTATRTFPRNIPVMPIPTKPAAIYFVLSSNHLTNLSLNIAPKQEIPYMLSTAPRLLL